MTRTSALLLLGLLAGCASSSPVGVVPDAPTLALSRARYVLPPEPPPPEPRSIEEQRRLEVEWPEVKTYAVTTWPQARARARRIELVRPASVPWGGYEGLVHSARPVAAKPVVVRLRSRRAETLPLVLLEVR